MDFNMDMVESVTILKDAASTAIYGSKAANGVVVIETKKPEKGTLRFSYTGDYSLSTPDLTDYNLMNAEEKLEFELKAGFYTATSNDAAEQIRKDSLYNAHRAEVARGVNTYWMSEPLRVSFSHKHNIYAEGGDDQMRYGFGVNYNRTTGVMKESSRDVLGGNLDLTYRKGKFQFANKLSIDYTNALNLLQDCDFCTHSAKQSKQNACYHLYLCTQNTILLHTCPRYVIQHISPTQPRRPLSIRSEICLFNMRFRYVSTVREHHSRGSTSK